MPHFLRTNHHNCHDFFTPKVPDLISIQSVFKRGSVVIASSQNDKTRLHFELWESNTLFRNCRKSSGNGAVKLSVEHGESATVLLPLAVSLSSSWRRHVGIVKLSSARQ
mmetsp:Transcript_8913/g.20146  ORF Transcript_8913/g.20146 Transcript_8913/m.20146 type:complete len:109 (+) Transcript_8913:55-381(+)